MTLLWSEPKDAAFVFEMHRLLEDIGSLVQGQDRDVFLTDMAKPHALAMYFLRLSEAANRVSKATREEHPQIAWRKIANLRHLIAHEYRKVDHLELWKIATLDVPELAHILPKPPPPEDIF